MNKIVSATEFKAKCLKLIAEMQSDGKPVTITKHGKVVAEVVPKARKPKQDRFGSVAGDVKWSVDPTAPVADPDDWAALN